MMDPPNANHTIAVIGTATGTSRHQIIPVAAPPAGVANPHGSQSSQSASPFTACATSSPLPPHPATQTTTARRTCQRQIGIGGGQVRLLGVHSEPGSFAFEEEESSADALEQLRQQKQQKGVTDIHKSSRKGEEEEAATGSTTTTSAARIAADTWEGAGSKGTGTTAASGSRGVPGTASTTRGRHHPHNQRQQSAMSSLYRQATVSAAAASVFNSTAITVANALEFVSNANSSSSTAEQQQPNVPPPSRPQSANSSGSFFSSTNTESGSVGCELGRTPTRRANKAPTLQCTSSEEGSDSPLFSRTTSAQSLPAPPQSQSLYERTLQLLTNDPQYQKEIALGKRVGFYRLGKELGAGNFSKVKLGVHVLTKEKVAVKIMEKSKMDQKAQRLLAREIDNMELMHHPNIIRLFEVVSTLSKVYLVMEYAGGGELYTYVHDNGKLTEEVAKPIFAQVVSAVGHLHSKNICHRDIKAENVFLSHPGWVKLGDFGFSCKYNKQDSLNTFCGSPPYAAPELFRDQHYDGPMVDIWAMGILLYFMLVGVTPFRGENVQDLKKNILEGVYYMPEYVSTFAQHSITRMLEIDAKRRANIAELKRTYWLNECRFPDSYVNLSLKPDEGSLDRSVLERQVWCQLNSYGINEHMIRSAQGKGAKNAIIGTYRITLYQCQARDRDEERAKLNEHLLQLVERNQFVTANINARSKTCSLL